MKCGSPKMVTVCQLWKCCSISSSSFSGKDGAISGGTSGKAALCECSTVLNKLYSSLELNYMKQGHTRAHKHDCPYCLICTQFLSQFWPVKGFLYCVLITAVTENTAAPSLHSSFLLSYFCLLYVVSQAESCDA